jgi:hypothetical protein
VEFFPGVVVVVVFAGADVVVELEHGVVEFFPGVVVVVVFVEADVVVELDHDDDVEFFPGVVIVELEVVDDEVEFFPGVVIVELEVVDDEVEFFDGYDDVEFKAGEEVMVAEVEVVQGAVGLALAQAHSAFAEFSTAIAFIPQAPTTQPAAEP